jgi:hypothetical protein
MSYTRRLVVALRSRGADEALIADVVREAEGLRMRDDALENELGAPEEYAAALVPDLPARRKPGPLVLAGLVAAGVWLIAVLMGRSAGWDVREAMGPFVLVPAVALAAAGIAGQFVSDYLRRPRG